MVLLVSLVLLLVVTLLGTAVMQGATMDMQMATNNQERQQAFNAAEAALRTAETYLDTVGVGITKLQSPCTGNTCFNASCTNGFCFFGTYLLTAPDQNQCLIVPSGSTPSAVGPWANSTLNVWDTSNRHVSATIPGYSQPAAYIIEFRCFIDGTTGGTVATNSGDKLFRITARGSSDSGRIQVMVQSTYRVAKN